MGSFRKRLLVLIIGLGVVTQTVTLAAVLVSTRHTVEARAAEQLRSGGAFAEQLIRFRAAQLANGVAVLAADRKSTRLNSSHLGISYAVFCLKKKKNHKQTPR